MFRIRFKINNTLRLFVAKKRDVVIKDTNAILIDSRLDVSGSTLPIATSDAHHTVDIIYTNFFIMHKSLYYHY